MYLGLDLLCNLMYKYISVANENICVCLKILFFSQNSRQRNVETDIRREFVRRLTEI